VYALLSKYLYIVNIKHENYEKFGQNFRMILREQQIISKLADIKESHVS